MFRSDVKISESHSHHCYTFLKKGTGFWKLYKSELRFFGDDRNVHRERNRTLTLINDQTARSGNPFVDRKSITNLTSTETVMKHIRKSRSLVKHLIFSWIMLKIVQIISCSKNFVVRIACSFLVNHQIQEMLRRKRENDISNSN